MIPRCPRRTTAAISSTEATSRAAASWGSRATSADRDAEENMNANPAGFTLVPIVGVVWDKAVRASEILEDEE